VWRRWYAQYYSRNIFDEERGPLHPTPSPLFHKHFANGTVDHLGWVNRFSRQLARENVNLSFREFCNKSGIPLPKGYRKTFLNLAASFQSLSKYDRPQKPVEMDLWALAGEWTKEHFYFMNGSCVLNNEVVCADLDKTTSNGYPANLHFPNKRKFFESPRLGFDCKLPSDILTDYWDVIGGENVDRIVPIWCGSQKNEMRSLEKLQLNKVRTFTAAPIEHTVALNRLCLDMNNKFYAGFNDSWSFVGSTKYLCGWDRLYRRLNKHPNAFELDESDYDASLQALFLLGQRDIRWSMLAAEFHTGENWNRMQAVYQSIIHSVVVLETGELIQKHTGNPSGCGNTISDNTMILYRLFAYAWLKLCPLEMRSRVIFEDNVEAALNGDDNTFTCSDLVVGWFNPTNIRKIWTEIGVTTKTPCETARPLSETTFLSQSFHYDQDNEVWLPKPETERVLCSLLYGASRSDVRFDLLRAHALRIESFGNEYCRDVIARYIAYLHKHYSQDFVGEIVFNDAVVTIKDIKNMWRSDDWIYALYSGKEKMCSDDLKFLLAAQNFLVPESNFVL